MAKIEVQEQKEFPTLPPDSIVFLKVQKVTIKTVNEGQSNEWKKCEFEFKILGIQHTGDGSPIQAYDELLGERIFGSVPFRMTNHPENKLRMWSEAILQMPLGLGFQLDTDDLENRQVRGITSTYTKRGTNITRHQVESLLNMGEHEAPRLPATPEQIAQEQQQGWGAPAGTPVADPWAQQQQAQQQQPWNPVQGTGVQSQPATAPAQGGWGAQGGGWSEDPGF